jgi:microcystin-dependent protein
MATPIIGQIMMFAGNFAPRGFAFCDGSLLPIDQFEALFALIGTTYGGDGQNTFAVPDLRGRLPLHKGQGPGLSNRIIGEAGGSETVSLSAAQIPAHSHVLQGTSVPGSTPTPTGQLWAAEPSGDFAHFSNAVPASSMAPTSSAGSNTPHDNVQPFLCILFASRN